MLKTECVELLITEEDLAAMMLGQVIWIGVTVLEQMILTNLGQGLETIIQTTPLHGKCEWREIGQTARGMTASGWPVNVTERVLSLLQKAGGMPVCGQTMSGMAAEHF